jgi:hypothetical protein
MCTSTHPYIHGELDDQSSADACIYICVDTLFNQEKADMICGTSNATRPAQCAYQMTYWNTTDGLIVGVLTTPGTTNSNPQLLPS